jgi:hypothetical protein
MEQFFLGGGFKYVEEFHHTALHDKVQLIEGKVDPVIRKAVLGEMVGPDPFGPVPAADLAFPGLRCGAVLPGRRV